MASMDLTAYFTRRRNDAIPQGGHSLYKKQLSRRLLTLRRKLGKTTGKGKKYAAKAPITAEDVDQNFENAFLLLLSAERAWAHAMLMKDAYLVEHPGKGVSGTARTHIVSRLARSQKYASQLVEVLESRTTSENHLLETLEARAYLCLIKGTRYFEIQSWKLCLDSFSEAHHIYSILGHQRLRECVHAAQSDAFRELLANQIDISIQYAGHQLRYPRAMPVTQIVQQHLNQDSSYVNEATKLIPEDTEMPDADHSGDYPKEISWRGRRVQIEDARIAQSIHAATQAEEALSSFLASAGSDVTVSSKAAEFDKVLQPKQDAVDACKTAIDELVAEKVATSDPRMQALQISRTAVNYEYIGRRIGRNRVLSGENDGYSDGSQATISKRTSKTQKLNQLREKIVLYDLTLQSLESILELPGVSGDQSLVQEIAGQQAYFTALRSLAIGRSQIVLGNNTNALALFAKAEASSAQTLASVSVSKAEASTVPSNTISPTQAQTLHENLSALVLRYRALVDMERLHAMVAAKDLQKRVGATPFVERLDEYPAPGVDLSNLVNYPPKLRPVPGKPIFLDIAFNYIDYPTRTAKAKTVGEAVVDAVEEAVPEPVKKRGWFGFGR